MKKLTITYVTLEGGAKQQHTTTEIVASTKSQNVLLRDYAEKDKFVKSVVEKDLFVDKAKTESAIRTAFADISDKATLEALVNHAMAALDGACMFVRPQVAKK